MELKKLKELEAELEKAREAAWSATRDATWEVTMVLARSDYFAARSAAWSAAVFPAADAAANSAAWSTNNKQEEIEAQIKLIIEQLEV